MKNATRDPLSQNANSIAEWSTEHLDKAKDVIAAVLNHGSPDSEASAQVAAATAVLYSYLATACKD